MSQASPLACSHRPGRVRPSISRNFAAGTSGPSTRGLAWLLSWTHAEVDHGVSDGSDGCVVGAGLASEHDECRVEADLELAGEDAFGLFDDDAAGQRVLQLLDGSSLAFQFR